MKIAICMASAFAFIVGSFFLSRWFAGTYFNDMYWMARIVSFLTFAGSLAYLGMPIVAYDSERKADSNVDVIAGIVGAIITPAGSILSLFVARWIAQQCGNWYWTVAVLSFYIVCPIVVAALMGILLLLLSPILKD